MQITSTGKNLNVLIRCNNTSLHSWLSLISWYSINRNLPDATVEVQCIRIYEPTRLLFDWVCKLKVPYRCLSSSSEVGKYGEFYKFYNENNFIITPDVFAVNEFKEDVLGPSDVKSSDNTTFVKVGDSCGKFVLSSWIDSNRAPFAQATSRFWTEDVSVNEMKVLKLWERMSHFKL